MLARALLPLLLAAALVLLVGEGLWLGGAGHRPQPGPGHAIVSGPVHGASVPFLLLYGPLHVALLVPVRVYALVTLASPRWETR